MIRIVAFIVFAALAWSVSSSARAQTAQLVSSRPYLFTPSATANSDQHNLAITSATALTVPADALFASICAKGGLANYRWDGAAPTGSAGNPLQQNQCVMLSGRAIITSVQFIQQTGSTTTLDVAYSK